MEDILYNIVIGNMMGQIFPDISHFSAAAVTWSQAKQSEQSYRKLKVPDQIINEDKEALKQAQVTDPNLDSIRRRTFVSLSYIWRERPVYRKSSSTVLMAHKNTGNRISMCNCI